MSYNPSLYNLYGSQQYQPTIGSGLQYQPSYTPQQPVNGLIKVTDIRGAEMYLLPPGSVSPPLFLEDENAFFIKTTDDGGAAGREPCDRGRRPCLKGARPPGLRGWLVPWMTYGMLCNCLHEAVCTELNAGLCEGRTPSMVAGFFFSWYHSSRK